MAKVRERVIDSKLLPHERPCWCQECKRAYHKAHRSRQQKNGVEYKSFSTCEQCGEKCSRRARHCRSCVAAGVKRTRPGRRVLLCLCGNRRTNPTSKLCRTCYLAQATKTKKTRVVCQRCRKTFASKTQRYNVCQACRRKAQDQKQLPNLWKPQIIRGRCTHCGAGCEAFVCSSCKLKNKRIHSRIYKNRSRGARTSGRYDKREIAIRDGWLCHICGGSVSPHLWGLIDPDAPNIDHIIPISRGGSDTAENVKLAHRLCNMRKFNKIGDDVGTRTKRKSSEIIAEANRDQRR